MKMLKMGTMNQLSAVIVVTAMALVSVEASAAQADCSHAVAAMQQTVGEALAHNSSFTSLVVSPHNSHNTIAVSEVTGKHKEIINPLIVRCEGRLLGYIGRLGHVFVVEVPANDARIVERIGPGLAGQKTVLIHNLTVAGLISSRQLRPGPVYGDDVSGFVAGKEVFGAALPESDMATASASFPLAEHRSSVRKSLDRLPCQRPRGHLPLLRL